MTILRPRGWHFDEAHLTTGGRPVVAALVDFGLHFFHNAGELLAAGSGPGGTLDGGTLDEDARRLFVDCAPGEDFPEFLTLQAYDVLLARGD